MLWFGQTFPFAQQYASSWSAAQLDGEALLMLDDEGLRDDIPIGVRAHRGIILKKIDALRTKARFHVFISVIFSQKWRIGPFLWRFLLSMKRQ